MIETHGMEFVAVEGRMETSDKSQYKHSKSPSWKNQCGCTLLSCYGTDFGGVFGWG